MNQLSLSQIVGPSIYINYDLSFFFFFYQNYDLVEIQNSAIDKIIYKFYH
jgi:hypothetical protein